MPLPKPGEGESQSEFMQRCMGETEGEFPDRAQRYAVCQTQWRGVKEGSGNTGGSMSQHRFSSLRPAVDLPQLSAALQKQPPGNDSERGWYTIKNLSEAESEVLIYDFIGYGGVTADDFIRELGEIKASKITLRVNSPGGDVFDGIAIYNAIARHGAEVTAYVDGIAASSASFLVMAADVVIMSPHSQMMIHEAHGLALGPADDMRKMAEILDKSSDNIAAIYAKRTGGTVAEWRERMKAETWFSDREAVDVGLADRVDREEPEGAEVAARLDNAEWTAKYINDLPDSAFAVILAGGSKDETERTVPRNLRKLPHHDISGGLDEAHLRNALSREPQADMPEAAHTKAKAHLKAHMGTEDVLSLAALPALQKGTSEIVRKQPVPDFDFVGAVKAGTAA